MLISRLWRRRGSEGPRITRVHHTKLIALLQQALRAAELEAETARLDGEIARLRGQRHRRERSSRARELVAERALGAEVAFNELELRGLVADPPAAEDDALDEESFLADLDEHIWARRLRALESSALMRGTD